MGTELVHINIHKENKLFVFYQLQNKLLEIFITCLTDQNPVGENLLFTAFSIEYHRDYLSAI